MKKFFQMNKFLFFILITCYTIYFGLIFLTPIKNDWLRSIISIIGGGIIILAYFLLSIQLRMNKMIKRVKKVLTPEIIKRSAYHEAGHTVMALISGRELKLSSIEIKGVVTKIKTEGGYPSIDFTIAGGQVEIHPITNLETSFSEINLLLSGIVAEQLCLGTISTGAQSDIEKAVMLVEDYVTLDKIKFTRDQAHPIDFRNVVAQALGSDRSEQSQVRIEEECSRIITEQYQGVVEALTKEKPAIEAIAQQLIEKEKILPEEIKIIWEENRLKVN